VLLFVLLPPASEMCEKWGEFAQLSSLLSTL
jgi:hypothetical protein